MSGDYDWSSLERQVRRAKEARRWETVTFPASGGGTLHYPAPSTLNGRPLDAGGPGEITIGAPPIGEIIRLHADAHLGNGGEPVFFDTALYRNGFAETIVPGSSITLPHDAIYGIEGGLHYHDGYCGGGTVTLVIDNQVYATLETFERWNRLSVAEEFDGLAGQRLQVFVDHDDTTTDHELHGVLEIATKEPLRQRVTDPAEFTGHVDTNSGSGSGTINVAPLGAEAGDLLVAFGSQNGAGSSNTLLDGFTLTHRVLGGGGPTVAMLTKVATGSEGSLSWSWPGSAAGATMWVCRVVNGQVVQTATANPAAGTNHTTPDAGAVAAGQLAFLMIGKSGGVSVTTPPSPATAITATSEPNGKLYWDDTAGTSVRTFVFNGSSNAPMITARVGAA